MPFELGLNMRNGNTWNQMLLVEIGSEGLVGVALAEDTIEVAGCVLNIC